MRSRPIAGQVVDRRAEADRARDVRRAGLELVGQDVVGRLLEGDRADHVAAALPRRHRLEQLRPCPYRTPDTRRPVDLVAGESVEVAAERRPRRPAGAAPPARRRRGPGSRARAPAQRSLATGLTVPSALETCATETMLRARGQEPLEFAPRGSAPRVSIGATRSLAPFSSQSICQGTMFEWCSRCGDQDLVARRRHGGRPIGLRDEVDPLRRAAHEDDLAGGGRADQGADLLADLLVGLRRGDGEQVHAAVHVGVVSLVDVALRLDDRTRASASSRRCRDRRGACRGSRRDRIGKSRRMRSRRPEAKAGAPTSPRAAVTGALTGPPAGTAGGRPRMASIALRTEATGMRCATSEANAYVIRARASASPMPRERR